LKLSMLGHNMTFNAANRMGNNSSSISQDDSGKSLNEILDELGIYAQPEGMLGQDPFPCPHCNMKFGETVEVSRHMRETHPDPMRCRTCEYSAKNPSNLFIHCWSKHMKVKPFKCVPKCGQKFVAKQARSTHIAVCRFHSPDAQKELGMTCPHCPEKFTNEDILFAHVKEHKQPMICKTCGKKSKNLSNFSAHWRIHTNEKPWTCLCGKRFSIKTFLKTHIVQCQNLVVGKRSKRSRKHTQQNRPPLSKKYRVSPSAKKTSPRGGRERQKFDCKSEISKKSFITHVQHVILSRARAQGISKLLALTLAGVSSKNGELLEWDIPPVKVEKQAPLEESTKLNQTVKMDA